MTFIKGHKINLGRKHSLKAKKKMRLAKLKNPNRYWLGKHHTQETKQKISKSKKGQIPWIKGQKGLHLSPTTEFKKGQIPWNKGKKQDSIRGEKHWNWKNGITVKIRGLRASSEYKEWRNLVLKRDNYICKLCGRNGNTADHIKRFVDFPELRFKLNNGRTLCEECHLKTDTYGYKHKEVVLP